jgi:hypothetical protein
MPMIKREKYMRHPFALWRKLKRPEPPHLAAFLWLAILRLAIPSPGSKVKVNPIPRLIVLWTI